MDPTCAGSKELATPECGVWLLTEMIADRCWLPSSGVRICMPSPCPAPANDASLSMLTLVTLMGAFSPDETSSRLHLLFIRLSSVVERMIVVVKFRVEGYPVTAEAPPNSKIASIDTKLGGQSLRDLFAIMLLKPNWK